MIRTLTGLFDTVDDAQSAAKELLDRGIPRENMSMVAPDVSNSHAQEHAVGAESTVGTGALGGSVVGGAVGLLVGAGLLAIPGIGPVLAIGPLAAAIGSIGAAVGSTALGAGVGASVGGLAGSLIDTGVPESTAHIYAEGVRRGGVLLTVSIDSAIAERVDVDAVLRHYQVVDINQRSADWHATGWGSATMTGASGPGEDRREAITEPGAVVKTGEETAADMLIDERAEERHTLPSAVVPTADPSAADLRIDERAKERHTLP